MPRINDYQFVCVAGSKFGGYGSFLPTYQRSPSWTCTKTPPDAYNNNISKSPSNLRPEVATVENIIK